MWIEVILSHHWQSALAVMIVIFMYGRGVQVICEERLNDVISIGHFGMFEMGMLRILSMIFIVWHYSVVLVISSLEMLVIFSISIVEYPLVISFIVVVVVLILVEGTVILWLSLVSIVLIVVLKFVIFFVRDISIIQI